MIKVIFGLGLSKLFIFCCDEFVCRDKEVVQLIWMDEIAIEYITNPNSERGQNDIRMEEIKASLQEIKQAKR